MNLARDTFLERVRAAVRAGNRPGAAAPLEARGTAGYQGAGTDPVARFCSEFTAVGGLLHCVASDGEAVARVLELAGACSAQQVLLGSGPVLNRLNLTDYLRREGIEVVPVAGLSAAASREAFFEADLGISGVDYLVAESGTIVVRARPGEPRSLSLLPPVHIVVAEPAQIVPDLFDLFDALSPSTGEATERPALLPSCVALITGPSKTGDIELKLVTGVHGPREVHLVLRK